MATRPTSPIARARRAVSRLNQLAPRSLAADRPVAALALELEHSAALAGVLFPVALLWETSSG